jgi:hypothetical protein
MNSETIEFINKYISLCDKTSNLIIHLGKQEYNNCFNTNIYVKNVTNILKYLESKNHKIVYNGEYQLSIRNNLYNIYDNGKMSVIQYEVSNFILNNQALIQFTKVLKDSNTFAYDTAGHDNSKCSIVVFNIVDGCNLEIIKKYNTDKITNYNIRLVISKPCDSTHITKILSLTSSTAWK